MLSLGKPIAIGRTAEVYAWEEGWVLKLFRDGWPAASVEHEARIARTVCAAGLAVPTVGDVVEIHGRLGILYEHVDGPSLLETCGTKPWTLLRSARLMAELHATLHICRVPALPSQRQQLAQRIRTAEALPVTLQQAALHTLQTLPDNDYLCHGDFHPGNVMLTAQGPIIIDWVDATRGNPLADVAHSSLLLRIGALPSDMTGRWVLEVGRHWLHMLYVHRYLRRRPSDRQQLAAWQSVVAAARVWENIPGERDRLLALVKAGISRHG